VTSLMACLNFQPDHNGECLNCDEWADAHDLARAVQDREDIAEMLHTQEQVNIALMAVVRKYLDNHCANADAEGMSALCECRVCREARALLSGKSGA